jgi:hypothetical protein
MPAMKLPRLRFSLRTLLIGVTLVAVICGYVGQQIEIVRNRSALLDQIVNRGSWYVAGDGFTSAKEKHPWAELNQSKRAFPTVSWFRRLLGDKAIERIGTPLSDPSIAEIRAAFPEAMTAGHVHSKPSS